MAIQVPEDLDLRFKFNHLTAKFYCEINTNYQAFFGLIFQRVNAEELIEEL